MSRHCFGSSSGATCVGPLPDGIRTRLRPRPLLRRRRVRDPSLILILSDINMPGMSGLDMLPKVRAERPDVPVIMITAYGDAETRRKAIERGAVGLLTKPIDFALLQARRSTPGSGRLHDGDHPLRRRRARSRSALVLQKFRRQIRDGATSPSCSRA